MARLKIEKNIRKIFSVNKVLYLIKRCTECDNLKSLTEFHRDSKSRDGRKGKCKDCRKEGRRPTKDYEEKYKNFSKRKKLKMLNEQAGKCKICNKKHKLVIDHCHTTDDVRGLLCNNCNTGLGLFKDSPSKLLNAAKYIVEKDMKNIFNFFKNNYSRIWNFIIF